MTNSNARSTSSYSNISISGSSNVMLGNYNVPDDTSQCQPMELLFRIFSTVLRREGIIRTPSSSFLYMGKLQEALVERTQEFVKHLEEQIESNPSNEVKNTATDLIEELEVLFAKLQDLRSEKRSISTRYENISITASSVHAGNRPLPTVPVYTYQLRKTLKEYFRTQGRGEVTGQKVGVMDTHNEAVTELPMRTVEADRTAARAKTGGIASSEANLEDGWEDLLGEDF